MATPTDERPSRGLFLTMSFVYFGCYFGLKYGVLGGELPWYYNLALIGACLAVVFAIKRNRQNEGAADERETP